MIISGKVMGSHRSAVCTTRWPMAGSPTGSAHTGFSMTLAKGELQMPITVVCPGANSTARRKPCGGEHGPLRCPEKSGMCKEEKLVM